MKNLEFVTTGTKTYLGEVAKEWDGGVVLEQAVEWDVLAVPFIDPQARQAGAMHHVTVGRILRIFSSMPKVMIVGAHVRIAVADFNEADQALILQNYRAAANVTPPRPVETRNGGPRIILPGS